MKFIFITILSVFMLPESLIADQDYEVAYKRVKYLFSGEVASELDYSRYGTSSAAFQNGVRSLIEADSFYYASLRYHERLFGVGLPASYLEELFYEDIDGKGKKVAEITCNLTSGQNSHLWCNWTSDFREGKSCSQSEALPASAFWYTGATAFVCPSVLATCGSNLSKCLVRYANHEVARYAELGKSVAFDSTHAVVKSLSKQSAGLAAAIVHGNYSYQNLLDPSVTAIDSSIAHFYSQDHHFKISDLNIHDDVRQVSNEYTLEGDKFYLVKLSGNNYERGGVLTTFGWLRRFEKNRTRANELYSRLLCKNFVADLPRVFPQDPGDLRTAPGCSGCHATLDPLADFFKAWGEGGDIYAGAQSSVDTYFNNQTGRYVSDLARIVREDRAFATCAVQNVWDWLIGRSFYTNEEELRDALTDYFIKTNYSFKELVFAVSTHPVFTDNSREASVVTEPLSEPPLGDVPEPTEVDCTDLGAYEDVSPYISECTSCHNSSSSLTDLSVKSNWQGVGSNALDMINSGQMPPGNRNSNVNSLSESLKCWIDQGSP